MAGEIGWVTLEETDTFAAEQIGSSAWTEARATSPSPCEAALLSAARRISQETFRGTRTDRDQPFAFPRSRLYDEDGYVMDADVAPDRVKRAQMKLAFVLLYDDEWLAANSKP